MYTFFCYNNKYFLLFYNTLFLYSVLAPELVIQISNNVACSSCWHAAIQPDRQTREQDSKVDKQFTFLR